jgi:hypothetical protein
VVATGKVILSCVLRDPKVILIKKKKEKKKKKKIKIKYLIFPLSFSIELVGFGRVVILTI